MIDFPLSDELQKLLAEQARVEGYASADDFLQSILAMEPPNYDRTGAEYDVKIQAYRAMLRALIRQNSIATRPLSEADFEEMLRALSSNRNLPPLPADFSRADIYLDHD